MAWKRPRWEEEEEKKKRVSCWAMSVWERGGGRYLLATCQGRREALVWFIGSVGITVASLADNHIEDAVLVAQVSIGRLFAGTDSVNDIARNVDKVLCVSHNAVDDATVVEIVDAIFKLERMCEAILQERETRTHLQQIVQFNGNNRLLSIHYILLDGG